MNTSGQTAQGPRFKVGDKVRLKTDPSRRGIVAKVSPPTGGTHYYQVYFSDTDQISYSEDKLEPGSLPASEFVTHREFLRDLLLLKLSQPLTDNLYSYRASRTVFRVYQFKPALKFLNSPEQRILIADEVGLGKTIEAGIIYLEIKARLDLQRVLVGHLPSSPPLNDHSRGQTRGIHSTGLFGN